MRLKGGETVVVYYSSGSLSGMLTTAETSGMQLNIKNKKSRIG